MLSSDTRTLSVRALLAVSVSLISGCAGATRGPVTTAAAESDATLAQVHLWRARPGKFDEYSRYVCKRAEPIDREAQRAGAFLTVTTFAVNETTVPRTRMRVFLLRASRFGTVARIERGPCGRGRTTRARQCTSARAR